MSSKNTWWMISHFFPAHARFLFSFAWENFHNMRTHVLLMIPTKLNPFCQLQTSVGIQGTRHGCESIMFWEIRREPDADVPWRLVKGPYETKYAVDCATCSFALDGLFISCSFQGNYFVCNLYIYICVRSHIDMLDQMCFHHRHECMDSTLCVSIYHLYMRYNCTSSRSHIAEYTYISNWGHQWQDDGNLSDVCAIAALCSLLHFRKAEGCDDHRLVATAYDFLRMQADVMLSGCWKITCAILVLVQLVIVIVVLRSTSARQTTTTTTPTATTTTTGLGILHEWGTITNMLSPYVS